MDADGDGHYTPGSCKKPNDDCNDADPTVYPGAKEICDGKDNDCDGITDEGCCEDKDGDGHYAISPNCPQGDDCDDNDSTIYPGAKEICDGKDNNCDGVGDYPPGIPHGSACNAYKDCGLKALHLYLFCRYTPDGAWWNCVRGCLLERWHNCKYINGFAKDHWYCIVWLIIVGVVY